MNIDAYLNSKVLNNQSFWNIWTMRDFSWLHKQDKYSQLILLGSKHECEMTHKSKSYFTNCKSISRLSLNYATNTILTSKK